jgi:hypothetical protein
MGEVIRRGAVTAKKWGSAFWADYAERVGSTLLYALLAWLVSEQTGHVSWHVLWTAIGLPVVFAAIKGLLANMKNAGTGASLLPGPPGPVLDDRGRGALIGISAAAVGMTILLALYLVPYLQALSSR